MVLPSGCPICANHMCKEDISLDVHGFHTLVVTIGQFPATTKKIVLGVSSRMISNIKKRNPGFSHFDLKSPLYLGVARILRWCRWRQVRWQRLERGNFVSLAKTIAVMPYLYEVAKTHQLLKSKTAVLPSLSEISAKTYQLLSYLSLYKRCCGEN